MDSKSKNTRILDRLKKRSDFLCVQGKGRKWVSKGLILQACKNDTDSIRVGFTVTKRVSKKAVIRNRIKRRLRALSADILQDYAADGYDYVLIGRVETLHRPYEVLQKDLKWCLDRMGLSKKA